MKVVVFSILISLSAMGEEAIRLSPPNSFESNASGGATIILEEEMTELDSKSYDSSDSKIKEAKANLSEDQIPVLQTKPKLAEMSTSGDLTRMVIALSIVMIMVFGLALAAKKWLQKRGTSSKQTSIRVVGQHFLGPRKSLAIVSVAGEFILIGVTDHNINMIKSLSLMDDEVPEQTPPHFNAALKSANEQPDFVDATTPPKEAEDGFHIKSIKDIVTKKLSGMKDLT